QNMLEQGSLLVVQVLAILLFYNALSEDCADCVAVAPGQEKVLGFEADGFVLPEQMIYSTNRKAKMQVPDIAVTKEQALRTINSYFEKWMHHEISSYLLSNGLSMEVLKQIRYMPSTYDPLQCNEVYVPTPGSWNVVEFDSESSGSAYNCVLIQNVPLYVCQSTKCSINGTASENGTTLQVPELQYAPNKFSTYKGSFKIYNAKVASWDNSTWGQIFQQVDDDLKSGEYGGQFSNLNINII
uniref:Inhibitor_I29 domain-containing protein n=1 Tax=Haemonchus contortus TaxID=6289 RepID=A0A7I5EC94_HAECO